MKKYILLTVAACAILTGCNASYHTQGDFKKGVVNISKQVNFRTIAEGNFEQSIVNMGKQVTFKTNKVTRDQEIAAFYLKADKGKKVSIPYTIKGLEKNKISLKIGRRILETSTYEIGHSVYSSSHSFVYEKELSKSQKGEINFVAKKSGNYAIIIGSGDQDENISNVTENIKFTAKLPK